VQSVRGVGLMIAIELIHPIENLTKIASEEFDILVNVTQGKIIRLLPPYIINSTQIEYLAQQIYGLLKVIHPIEKVA
jgi:acetylornithine aminotransferase